MVPPTTTVMYIIFSYPEDYKNWASLVLKIAGIARLVSNLLQQYAIDTFCFWDVGCVVQLP